MPADEDNYPSPLVSRPRTISGLWRVVALAAGFIIVAVGISVLGDYIPPDAVLGIAGQRVARGRIFADAPPGGVLWYENADGLAEIAVNGGSAAATYGLAPGSPLTVHGAGTEKAL